MNAKEWSKIWRDPHLKVELLHALYTTHAYPRHVHDYYVICFIEKGVQSFSHRETKYITPPGGLIVLNPDEPHTGEAATPHGFEYRAIYPTVEHMQAALFELAGRRCQDIPFFPAVRLDNPQLAGWIRDLHLALINDTSPLERESRFLWVLTQLISRYADARPLQRAVGRAPGAVRQACRYIDDRYAEGVTLTELAAQVGLSPYYFLRVFRQEMGIPPHAYLESVRIRQAQRLLAEGFPPIQVAYEVGFSDQSHFTHRFKRFIGVTPGQYAQLVNNG
jgi:AraC-like DNA-binding protein